ncbi:MAG: hypothetical protein IVW51_15390 [Thermaceae bacterium]|nr:hypothetical protein [Thermaceae bacterium]
MTRLSDAPILVELRFYRGEVSAFTFYIARDLSATPPRMQVRDLADNPVVLLQPNSGLAVSSVPVASVPPRPDGKPHPYQGTWTRVDIAPTVAQRESMFGKSGLVGDLAFALPAGDFTPLWASLSVGNDVSR